MGGLLVSYRLRGGLDDATSTEGGMTGGYEGLVMESCKGETLGALVQADGDGVLAPLVLAMADVKKLEKGVAGGAWGALLQTEVLWNPLGDDALVWLNFALEGAFRRLNYRCEMKYSNLEAYFVI